MFSNWLKAQEAEEAGCALADAFPPHARHSDDIREFLQRASGELRSLRFNFYKRVRFANAFKWRLRANGVKPETAAEVTQTLLIQVMMPPVTAAADPESESPTISNTAIRKLGEDLQRQAQEAFAKGAYQEAVTLYEKLAPLRARDADILNGLGAALGRLGRIEAAEQQFRKAIAYNPKHAEAYVNLGAMMLPRGRVQDAENCFRRALKLKPTDSTARSNLGLALVLLGRLEAARIEFQKILKMTPRHAGALHGMGMLARAEGRFNEAEDMFRRALVSDPQMARSWSALVGVRKMNSQDAIWLKRAEQTADSLTSAAEEADIRFAIGKYFDDLGRYEQAFQSYKRGNELLKSVAPAYDREARTRFVDDMIRLYTPEALARGADPSGPGRHAVQPVFVVGMPRSGTSLTEQILASHPAVDGAGELPFWADVVRRDNGRARQELLAGDMRRRVAQDYLRALAHQCPSTQYVVDKTPLNSDYLGLIHSVFPNARIIYMQRDPIDACLSCYFQHFTVALNFTLDLSDLAHYYSEHARLMAHWRQVLPPGTILDVPYEALVGKQEPWTRKILNFLGLDWDARCLDFHRTQRAVVTSSYWQVRQPLYADSIQRWRKYASFIGPLRGLKTLH